MPFFSAYLGGNFFPLLDVSERNFFFQVGGGGARAPSALPPSAYAPVYLYPAFKLAVSTGKKCQKQATRSSWRYIGR